MKTYTFFVAIVLFSAVISACGGDGGSCEDASQRVTAEVDALCGSEFSGSGFCDVCVAARFYSVDDSCRCQPLIFDADFCYYDDDVSGMPKVRAAMQYASEVCRDRQPELPFGEGAGGAGGGM